MHVCMQRKVAAVSDALLSALWGAIWGSRLGARQVSCYQARYEPPGAAELELYVDRLKSGGPRASHDP